MRKAMGSIVVVAFAGLLGTSLLAVFSGARLGQQYTPKHEQLEYPYFMAY